MPTIEQKYEIRGRIEDVWDALTDPGRIVVWSGQPADFKPEPGTDYSLWDGDIRGKVLEAVPNERLVQTWRPDNYTDDSVVTFTLTPTEQGTEVSLIHENVPDWDYDDTNQGWDVYYLGAVKKMIEGQSPNRQPAGKTRAVARGSTQRKRAEGKSGEKKNAPAPKRTATGRKPTAKRPATKVTARRGSAAKRPTAKKSTRTRGR